MPPALEQDLDKVVQLDQQDRALISLFVGNARRLCNSLATHMEALHEEGLVVYVNLLKQLSQSLAHTFSLVESLGSTALQKLSAAQKALQAIIDFTGSADNRVGLLRTELPRIQAQMSELKMAWDAGERSEQHTHQVALAAADQILRIVTLITNGLERSSFAKSLGPEFLELKDLVDSFKGRDFAMLVKKETEAESAFAANLASYLQGLQDKYMRGRFQPGSAAA